MIAQLVDKLYVNETTDHQTQATVSVEESGTYQVSIFATNADMGIVNTDVEYRELIEVMAPTVPTILTTTGSQGTL